jgi:hypothetical protein
MSAKPFLVAGAIGLAIFIPAIASAQQSPIPTGSIPGSTQTVIGPTEHVEHTTKFTPPPNRMLLAAGIGMFGIPYVTSVVVAATTTRGSNNHLYIPVAGPWLALGLRDCSNPSCSSEWLSGTMLVADGILQAAGVATAVGSFFIPEKLTTVKVGKAAKVTFAPAKEGRDGYGLAAVGEF